jgi:hypothetical protein
VKAKEAHQLLSQYSGEELYQKARELMEKETSALLELRIGKGKEPTPQAVDSVCKQIADWFKKVYPGLAWSNKELPEEMISWNRGRVFATCNLVDPILSRWSKRTRKEVAKGTPLPILAAMKAGDLKAAGSFMLGQIQLQAQQWSELHEKRKAFLAKMGKKQCIFTAKARSCPYQKSYAMVYPLPTSTADIAFACTRQDGRCEFKLEELKHEG